MKNNTLSSLQRQNILRTTIALSLGVMMPFSCPSVSFAGETTADAQYSSNHQYISPESFVWGYKSTSDLTQYEALTINNHALVYQHSDGEEYYPFVTDTTDSLPGLLGEISPSEAAGGDPAQMTYNAMSVAINGEKYCVSLVNDVDEDGQWLIAQKITPGALNSLNAKTKDIENLSVQKDLMDILKLTDDTEKETRLKAFMKHYAPDYEYFLVKLSEEELARLNELEEVYDEATTEVSALAECKVNPEAEFKLEGLKQYWFEPHDVELSPSPRSYAYNQISVGENGDNIWRPMDRVFNTAGSSDTGVGYPFSWEMDKEGNIALGDEWVEHEDTTGFGPLHHQVRTAITVQNLTTEKDAVIDLSYANTSGAEPLVNHILFNDPQGNASSNGKKGFFTGYFAYDHTNHKVVDINLLAGEEEDEENPERNYQQHKIARDLWAENATLAEGTVFRVGNYEMKAALQHAPGSHDNGFVAPVDFNSAMVFFGEDVDSIYIADGRPAKPGGKTNLYIQLGWVPGLGYLAQGDVIVKDLPQTGMFVPAVLGMLKGGENFEVTGQTSLADGVLSSYEITPVIEKTENFFTDPEDESSKTGTVWWLKSYTFADTGELSLTGKAVSDNAAITHNLWRANYLNLFRRPSGLHTRYGDSAQLEGKIGTAGDGRENIWAEAWHGKFDGKGYYGGSFDQKYTGYQVGFDKLLSKAYYNGRIYAGLYLNKIEGRSATQSGGGNQKNLGGGAYATWVGDKGHYVDLGATAGKLRNEYRFTGNLGDGTGAKGTVKGISDTWAYGLGLQYGKINELPNGWWWEPTASFFAGHMDETGYVLSNHLGITQKGQDMATGRLKLLLGKKWNNDSNVYMSVNLAHDFAGEQGIKARYGYQNRSVAASGGKDTWWEWNVGGNVKISPNGRLNLDFVKTGGSNTGSEWRVDGGLEFTWGGFSPEPEKSLPEKRLREDQAVSSETHNPTIIRGKKDVFTSVPKIADGGSVAAEKQSTVQTETGTVRSGSGGSLKSDSPQAVVPIVAGENSERLSVNEGQEKIPAFALETITVEARRPDWEKALSPGQVSVVYPDQYRGEQKDLPELLENVPGLYVQRVTGAGHYTVARVRGATGAQVKVFVDGVLMNLNSESAVNLSAIPVDNVARIEVYRGYVPARFSGAPLGGVINIVSKKPEKTGGLISQGIRSYGGYIGNYQASAPLGGGSLLATFQRDIWNGDFNWHAISPDPSSPLCFDGEVKRTSNGYRNSNGMVKWQDEHWQAKASWKKLFEELPYSVASSVGADDIVYPWQPDIFYTKKNIEKGYWDSEQQIDQKEFLLGRRNTVGNLEWGWELSYLDNKKDYYNTGYYRRKAVVDAYQEKTGMLWGPGGMEDPHYPASLWAHYHSRKWGLNVHSACKMGDSHLLEFNADVSHEKMKANVSGAQDLYMTGFGYLCGRKYIDDYKIREYRFSLQDTITLNRAGDLKLTPVIRAEKVDMETMNSADKQWQYSAGAALQKQFNEHWGMKTSWGTYHRHPNFYELFGDGATIAPNDGAAEFFGVAGRGTWESGTQYDISLNWQGKLAQADTDTVLTYFHRQAKNQFALWVPMMPNAHSTYFPMDQSRVRGLELTHNMKWRRLDLSLAATWQDAWYSGSGKTAATGHGLCAKSFISYTPKWVLNMRLDYRFPGDKLDIFAEYNYMDKQFTGNTKDDSSPDKDKTQWMDHLATVDLGAKYKFDRHWKMTAGIKDLFDQGPKIKRHWMGFDTVTNYPLPGRTWYATLEYKY